MKLKAVLIYLSFLMLLLVLSISTIVWLNESYLIGKGYVVFAFLIMPLLIVFGVTNYVFSFIKSFKEKLFIVGAISFIWLVVAALFIYHLLLNNFGA